MYKCFCRSATCLLPPARLFQSRYAGGIFALPRRGVLAAPTPALPHGGEGAYWRFVALQLTKKPRGHIVKPLSCFASNACPCGTGTTCKARERGWGKGSKRLKNGNFTSQAISLAPLPRCGLRPAGEGDFEHVLQSVRQVKQHFYQFRRAGGVQQFLRGEVF